MARNSEAKVISRVRRQRSYKKVVLILLLVAFIQFAAIESLLVSHSGSDRVEHTEYLVILGAGLWGETPSPILKERLAAGLLYLKEYPDTKVVVSGGQGRGESITEAEAMRRYLVSNGIEGTRILKEDRSTSTMENFKYTAAMIERKSGKPAGRITFVTSNFHVFRARLLAGRNHLDAAAVSCRTPASVVVPLYIREYLALVKSFLIDR